MSDTPLTLGREGPVAVLTLSRPQSRNALSLATLQALDQTLADVGSDSSARVLVIAAEGRAFSAGHDLRELQAHRNDSDEGRAFFEQTLQLCGRVMKAIVRLPQPVIAAVEGVATAAGCQLVASCDLAVAGADARFATPGVNIGLFCTTPMVALTRNLPAKPAMEMLLTGDMIGADEALRLGLVNRVAPAGQALPTALALAQQIAARPERIVALGKAAFHAQRTLDLDEAYAYATGVMLENMLAGEAQEGFAAFLEKRKPNWK